MRTSQCHHIYPLFYYGFSRRVALVEAMKKISWVIGSPGSSRPVSGASSATTLAGPDRPASSVEARARTRHESTRSCAGSERSAHPLASRHDNAYTSARASRSRYSRRVSSRLGLTAQAFENGNAGPSRSPHRETPPIRERASDRGCQIRRRALPFGTEIGVGPAGTITQDPYTSPKPRHAKTFLVQTLANVTPWRYNYAHIQNERAANNADDITTTR